MRTRNFSLLTLMLIIGISAVLFAVLPRFFRGPAHSGQIDGISIRRAMHATPGGSCLDFRLDFGETDAQKTPAWENHAETPPLSSRRALEIADEFSQQWFNDVQGADYALKSLELSPVLPDRRKWCWIAKYQVKAPEYGELPITIRMDGVVLTQKR